MLTPVVNSGPSKVDPNRVAASLPSRIDGQANRPVQERDTPAARFAKLGPPIDVTRVGEIRAAIANGSYTVDADRLAAAMLALDLPENAA